MFGRCDQSGRLCGCSENRPRRPEADSYRAIAVRYWPASRAVGCTGVGRKYRRSFGPLNSPEYGEEDRMTTVAAKPSAPAAEQERRRLTALEGVAALSLDALLSAAYGPEAAALPARQLGAGS